MCVCVLLLFLLLILCFCHFFKSADCDLRRVLRIWYYTAHPWRNCCWNTWEAEALGSLDPQKGGKERKRKKREAERKEKV